MMLEANPGDEGRTESEVEKPFVRNSKDDKYRGESKEYYNQPMKVMIVGLKAVQEWDG